MHPRDQTLLLDKLLEIDRELLLAVSPASDPDDLLGDLLGRKQRRLALICKLRLDVFPKPPQALQLVLVHGHADVADDALAHLAAVAHALDQLHRAAGAVGRGLDAHEHGGSIARNRAICNQEYLLGTTPRPDRAAAAKSLSLMKSLARKAAGIRLKPSKSGPFI